jgi:hypothetical protein
MRVWIGSTAAQSVTDATQVASRDVVCELVVDERGVVM